MFKTLKTKIDNLKSNFLNLKYIKKSIKFYNILKDLAIKYKLITPKKEEPGILDKFDKYLKSTEIKLKKEIEKKKYSKNSKVRTCKFSFVEIILIYFISIFITLFTMPWILFFFLLGPIVFIFLFVGHLTIFFSLIYAE